MALYSVVAGNTALAADLNQYLNALTGVMTDQVFQLNNRVAIGPSAAANVGLYLTEPATAVSGNAFGLYDTAPLVAAANGDALWAMGINANQISTGTFTGLTLYGLNISAAGMTKTGTGTITAAYGLYVTAPTIGTANYAGYFSGQVLFTQKYLFIGTNTAGTTIGVGSTDVPWTASSDPNSNFATPNYTVPRTGKYVISFGLTISDNHAGGDAFVAKVAGTTAGTLMDTRTQTGQSVSTLTTLSGSGVFALTAAETVKVTATDSFSSPLATGAGNNWFSIMYLSD